VLASMLQQGADIGDIMDDLLFNGDRAGAWFGIRYMDREAEPVNGIKAAHRYFQSDVFELYNDPDFVDIDEAEDVGRAYAQNRAYVIGPMPRTGHMSSGTNAISIHRRSVCADIAIRSSIFSSPRRRASPISTISRSTGRKSCSS
jgi:hypothetical protein